MTTTPDFAFQYVTHKTNVLDGDQFLFRFDNGYGASIVRHRGSYGYKQGLWELALIKWDGDNFELVYNDFYEDVKGWCNESDLNQHLRRISSLTG